MKCRRSVTKSIRKCEVRNSKYFDSKSDEICTTDDVMERDCLDLEGCDETGMYLATEGESCERFCAKKSK